MTGDVQEQAQGPVGTALRCRHRECIEAGWRLALCRSRRDPPEGLPALPAS